VTVGAGNILGVAGTLAFTDNTSVLALIGTGGELKATATTAKFHANATTTNGIINIAQYGKLKLAQNGGIKTGTGGTDISDGAYATGTGDKNIVGGASGASISASGGAVTVTHS
jgi:hypothetical protein